MVTKTGLRSGIATAHSQFRIYRNDRINSSAAIVMKGLSHQLIELIENVEIKICMNSYIIDNYSYNLQAK